MTEQTEPGTQLVPATALPPRVAYEDPFANIQQFEDGQRIAKAIAAASLLPPHFANNLANCLHLLAASRRMRMPVMDVATNLNVIHNRPSWSATFVAALINSSGMFTPLRYEMRGAEGSDDWSCRVAATDVQTREPVHGPWVSIRMAKAEGWYNRPGSKWATMPQMMLHYRAISFFGKLYAGHILTGMTTDEVEDFMPRNGAAVAAAAPEVVAAAPEAVPDPVVEVLAGTAGLNSRVRRRREQRAAAAEAPAEPAAAEPDPAAPAGAAPPNPEEFF